jgi:hypothetical protein
MVKTVDNVTLDTMIQVSQVADHPGDRIYLPADRYLYDIIVTVAVGIAALAVDLAVLLLAVSLRIEAMRSTHDISTR